jgi:hypothetical protein
MHWWKFGSLPVRGLWYNRGIETPVKTLYHVMIQLNALSKSNMNIKVVDVSHKVDNSDSGFNMIPPQLVYCGRNELII